MIRALSALLCSLNLAAPSFPHKLEAAHELNRVAARNNVDPFTIVELVRLESRWLTYVVNPKSGAVGLGQHLPRDASDAEALLDWRYNLQRTGAAMAAWREYCREKVGSALAKFWLRGYGGFPHGANCGHALKRGRWVALPVQPYVAKLLAGRRKLIRECVR